MFKVFGAGYLVSVVALFSSVSRKEGGNYLRYIY